MRTSKDLSTAALRAVATRSRDTRSVPVLLLALLASTLAASAQRVVAIDAAVSTARFSVEHIWVSKVTGTVPISGGSVTLAGDDPIPLAVRATLDATHIQTGEPDRDASLRSPDFFDTVKFPTWTFVSARIVPNGPRDFEIDGNLTIHGVTQPERLDATVEGAAPALRYHATGKIDRHAFGMSQTRLDPTIGTTVDVTLDVSLGAR